MPLTPFFKEIKLKTYLKGVKEILIEHNTNHPSYYQDNIGRFTTLSPRRRLLNGGGITEPMAVQMGLQPMEDHNILFQIMKKITLMG